MIYYIMKKLSWKEKQDLKKLKKLVKDNISPDAKYTYSSRSFGGVLLDHNFEIKNENKTFVFTIGYNVYEKEKMSIIDQDHVIKITYDELVEKWKKLLKSLKKEAESN